MHLKSLLIVLSCSLFMTSCYNQLDVIGQKIKDQDFILQLVKKDSSETVEIYNEHGLSIFSGKDSVISYSIQKDKWTPVKISNDTLVVSNNSAFYYQFADSSSKDSMLNEDWTVNYYSRNREKTEFKKEKKDTSFVKNFLIRKIDSVKYQQKNEYPQSDGVILGGLAIITAPFTSWENGKFKVVNFFAQVGGGLAFSFLTNVPAYINNRDIDPKFYKSDEWTFRTIRKKQIPDGDSDDFGFNYKEHNSGRFFTLGLNANLYSGTLKKHFSHEVGVSASKYYFFSNVLVGLEIGLHTGKVNESFYLNREVPDGLKASFLDLNLMTGYQLHIGKYFSGNFLGGVSKSWMDRGDNEKEFKNIKGLRAESKYSFIYGFSISFAIKENFDSIYEKDRYQVSLSYFNSPLEFGKNLKGRRSTIRLEYKYSTNHISIF